MSLHGHSILIVDSSASPFVTGLQESVDQTGAECLVARDAQMARERCQTFRFTGALLHADHGGIATELGDLGLRVVVYRTTQTPQQIVRSLIQTLGPG
jgi:hypothetical protein